MRNWSHHPSGKQKKQEYKPLNISTAQIIIVSIVLTFYKMYQCYTWFSSLSICAKWIIECHFTVEVFSPPPVHGQKPVRSHKVFVVRKKCRWHQVQSTVLLTNVVDALLISQHLEPLLALLVFPDRCQDKDMIVMAICYL